MFTNHWLELNENTHALSIKISSNSVADKLSYLIFTKMTCLTSLLYTAMVKDGLITYQFQKIFVCTKIDSKNSTIKQK